VNQIKGLTYEEAERIRRESGSNELKAYAKPSFFSKFIKNLSDPIIRILIIAFFITLLFSGDGGVFESVGIAASVLISTFVSTVSEYGSEKAFRKMQEEAKGCVCTVIRDGKESELPITEVVKGDLIVLKAGDTVAADGVIVSGEIACDLSAVNGESGEKTKRIAPENTQTGSPSDNYSLFRGCNVTAGNAIMRVSAVGENTYYGRIAGEIQIDNGDSPLRKKLSALAETLSRFGYFCAVLVALSHLVYTFGFDPSFVISTKSVLSELMNAFTLAISVVVVAVPEGLPMMITVVLSSNMIRMQKQGIRVRKPVGIETAGNVDILFTDKTGTLTHGTPRTVCYVTGEGDRASRSIHLSPVRRFLLGLCAVHGGGCRIEGNVRTKKARAVSGDSGERAILDEYLTCGELPDGAEMVAHIGFDSRIKLSGASVDLTRNREKRRILGENVTLIKGAPEMILKHCRTYVDRDGVKRPIDEKILLSELGNAASKGMRVLAVALSEASADQLSASATALSRGETVNVAQLLIGASFLCFVCMRDELRREAKGAVYSLKNAGVQTVMVTGDGKLTAKAIASEVGILSGAEGEMVLESDDMRKMSDEELLRVLPSLRVVARAMPDDKSRLVRIATSLGRVTAMTGDGLNDAPALKAADVGFAMGSGTDVAKEAGDIVINNNDISTVRRAVLYGRTIFRSIRKFVVFQLIMNLGAVGISIIGPFIGFENPVTVVQMLWINLIMDTLAAIAFAGEAPMEKYMKCPPTPVSEGVLNGDMITRIFVMGVFTVMVCLYFCLSPRIVTLFDGIGSISFKSGFFALFVFCGVFGAFIARSGRMNIFAGLLQNPVFISVMAAVFCAQLGMIYFGGELFRCAPLSVEQLKRVVMIAFLCVPYGIFVELLLKKKIKNAAA
jgi:calcium-translocating P-type ATPase